MSHCSKKNDKIMLDSVLKVHSVTHLLFRYKKNFMISFSCIILFIITFHELRFKPGNESVLEVSVYLERLTSDSCSGENKEKINTKSAIIGSDPLLNHNVRHRTFFA